MKGTKVDLEVKPGNPGTQTLPSCLAHSRSRVLPFVRTLAPPRVASSHPSPTSDISKVNSTHQPCSPPQPENGCSESSQPTSGTKAEIKGDLASIRPHLVSSQILTIIKDSYWSLVFERQITRKLKSPHKKLAKVSGFSSDSGVSPYLPCFNLIRTGKDSLRFLKRQTTLGFRASYPWGQNKPETFRVNVQLSRKPVRPCLSPLQQAPSPNGSEDEFWLAEGRTEKAGFSFRAL